MDIEAEAEARLPQPSASKFSAVINGVGNGATAGVAMFGIPKLWDALRGHAPRPDNYKMTAIATVVGTALGTVYGMHEAKQLGEYRDAIGEEIIKLRGRVQQLEGKHPRTHAEKIIAGREAAEHDDILRS